MYLTAGDVNAEGPHPTSAVGVVTSLTSPHTGRRRRSGLCCVSARLGAIGGVLLGAVTGTVLTIVAAASDGLSYGAVLGLWATAVAILLGGAVGLLVGALNGAFLHALPPTAVLRNREHILSRTRVSAAAFLIAGLSSFPLLSILFRGSPDLIYPLTGAAALLAFPSAAGCRSTTDRPAYGPRTAHGRAICFPAMTEFVSRPAHVSMAGGQSLNDRS